MADELSVIPTGDEQVVTDVTSQASDVVVTDTTTEVPEELNQEDKEWAEAIEELKGEEFKDVTANTTESTTETTTVAPSTTETTTAKPVAETEEKTSTESDTTGRDARALVRQEAELVKVMEADVKEKMFPDVKDYMQDGDGNPITSVQDVMKLIDPRTISAENPQGLPFTETDATIWLSQAQLDFNKKQKEIEDTIHDVAEVNVSIKDDSDYIMERYGELLKEMPEEREALWKEYEKTLERDPVSGIITKVRSSLKNFYETRLEPLAKLGESLEAQEAAQLAAEEAKKKTEKIQTHSDREEIYGSDKSDVMDSDEKEWSDAAKAYFER